MPIGRTLIVIQQLERECSYLPLVNMHLRDEFCAIRDNLEAGGDMSLQNALDIVRGPLSNVPQYGTREVLFLVRATPPLPFPGTRHMPRSMGGCFWWASNMESPDKSMVLHGSLRNQSATLLECRKQPSQCAWHQDLSTFDIADASPQLGMNSSFCSYVNSMHVVVQRIRLAQTPGIGFWQPCRCLP